MISARLSIALFKVSKMELSSLQKSLTLFLQGLDVDNIVSLISQKADISEAEASEQFKKYQNETFFALRVVEKHLSKEKRIIEVGSGTCLFAYFLKHEGYDITALEPVGVGYDFMRAAQYALKENCAHIDLPILEIGAEQLSVSTHGAFDFVFSIHVLEHLPSYKDGLTAMDTILAKDGEMVHACPNYSFPYDPHFSIPLVPIFPSLTRFLLPSRISKSGKWASINFIKFRKLKSLAKSLGYSVQAEPSVLYEMVNRIQTDKYFGERHGAGFSGFMISLFRKLGLLRLVKFIPVNLSSPVIFKMSRN